HPIFSRRSSKGESADHRPANHEIHLSHRCRRSLSLQHLKVVAMIRCASFRLVAFLKSFGDFFSNRSSPSPVSVLPREAIMFSRRAEDTLCVLVYLRTIMLFLSILMLCLNETTTNLDNVQFVSADAPIQYFLTARFRIKRPLAFLLHDRDGKRKI